MNGIPSTKDQRLPLCFSATEVPRGSAWRETRTSPIFVLLLISAHKAADRNAKGNVQRRDPASQAVLSLSLPAQLSELSAFQHGLEPKRLLGGFCSI